MVDINMEIAWRDFINWASRNKEVVTQFNKETKRQFLIPTSPINLLVDKATGKDLDDVQEFVFWVTKNLWGVKYSPKKLQQELKKRRHANGR
jgi:hypothetical protein